jgi:hypothetical protein
MHDFKSFVLHLKFEAVALALLMTVLAFRNPYSAWWLLGGFLLVDIGMAGYFFGNKVGAICYNLTHNATIPTLFVAVGVINDWSLLSMIGIVWTFHITIDRLLGYGLKHPHSFRATHLGSIGKTAKK